MPRAASEKVNKENTGPYDRFVFPEESEEIVSQVSSDESSEETGSEDKMETVSKIKSLTALISAINNQPDKATELVKALYLKHYQTYKLIVNQLCDVNTLNMERLEHGTIETVIDSIAPLEDELTFIMKDMRDTLINCVVENMTDRVQVNYATKVYQLILQHSLTVWNDLQCKKHVRETVSILISRCPMDVNWTAIAVANITPFLQFLLQKMEVDDFVYLFEINMPDFRYLPPQQPSTTKSAGCIQLCVDMLRRQCGKKFKKLLYKNEKVVAFLVEHYADFAGVAIEKLRIAQLPHDLINLWQKKFYTIKVHLESNGATALVDTLNLLRIETELIRVKKALKKLVE